MAEINVTPFVDVMLVLLIIFMVTAPLLASGVPVELPESRAAALDQDIEPMQVSIDASGQIYVDDAAVSELDLPPIFEARAARPAGPDGHSVFLRADTSLDYGRVMLVMGELNRAGLNRISLVTTSVDSAPGGAGDDDGDAAASEAPADEAPVTEVEVPAAQDGDG